MSAPIVGSELAKALGKPFPASDIEWRVQAAGKKGSRGWARVVPYISNRAIQDRLDYVVGPENWRNEYRETPGGMMCGISIRFVHGWVTKWDGADDVADHPVKGVASNAMKRAGVQWGIGRYLYGLDAGFAQISDNGEHRGRYPQKDGGAVFRWDPPALPRWALPEEDGSQGPTSESVDKRTGEITEEPAKQKAPLLPSAGTVEAAKAIRQRVRNADKGGYISDEQAKGFFRDIDECEDNDDVEGLRTITDTLTALATAEAKKQAKAKADG